jgi:hypothetical protein
MAKCVELRRLSGAYGITQLPQSHSTLAGIQAERVRDCDLKELAMPDLDVIKQEEQGARDRRGRFARGRSGNPAGRAAAATMSTPLPGFCSPARARR